MTHVTCRLTAKNRDQLWNPTLGNRVWATFTFFYIVIVLAVPSLCYSVSCPLSIFWATAPRGHYVFDLCVRLCVPSHSLTGLPSTDSFFGSVLFLLTLNSCASRPSSVLYPASIRRLATPWTRKDNIKTWTGLHVEESIRVTEDKWRKYVHGVANPGIEDS